MSEQVRRIGDILVAMDFITEDILKAAIAKQKELKRERLGDVLIEFDYVKQEDLARALAEQFSMDLIDLSDHEISQTVIDMVPKNFALEHHLVPVDFDGEKLLVAMSEPLDLEVMDNLRFLINSDIDSLLATKSDIDKALEKYYGITESSIDNAVSEFTETNISFREENFGDDEEMNAEDAPVIRLVTMIISEAVRSRASDIHVEPMADKVRIRYRIDGECYEVDSPPKRLQGAVLARLKIMGKMNMAEKRRPQDGRIKLSVMGRPIDLRVNSLPAVHGESVVMRILDKESVMFGVQQLGFHSDDYAIFNSMIKRPNGVMLVTGPTGSGKTTTLYAALNELNRSDRKLITAEDPVEYNITGINQAQVNRKAGMTFDKIIRAMLRQAPNIILVGEIRDGETAQIAIEAALTGHLVFSTLHTNDAPSSITRLIDMDVPPFLVAGSVQAVLAQRLVRRICPDCKQEIPPEIPLLKAAGVKDEMIAANKYYAGEGCEKCKNIGYKGRRGIYEIMLMTSRIREMAFRVDTTDNIRRQAVLDGMHTLLDDGIRKVFEGVTTVGEVLSVAKRMD